MTGLILCGGRSLRMGTNKAFVMVDGVPMIHRVLRVFQRLFQESIIAASDDSLFSGLGVKVVLDRIPGRGVLGGLYSGLTEASFPFSFVAACDMPFLDPGVIEALISMRGDADMVVPRTDAGFEPLHALYGKEACLGPMEANLKAGKNRIVDIFPFVRVKVAYARDLGGTAVLARSISNVNTPWDLVALHTGDGERMP
jgi:molybdopterin-guanine dinucleotide biosynthesis protein A